MVLEIEGEIIYWRGPAPYYYLTVPDEACAQMKEIARFVTFGWGMIPANVRAGGLVWYTAIFPKDGRYLVPIRKKERERLGLQVGSRLNAALEIGE